MANTVNTFPITETVNVTVGLVKPAGGVTFNKLLYVSETALGTKQRVSYYTSLDEMKIDGWVDTDDAFIAASVVFSQTDRIAGVYIGIKETAETWTVALDAIRAVDDSFYGVAISDNTTDVIQEVAGYIEPLKKLFFPFTIDVGVVDPVSTTDVLTLLGGMKRTMLFWDKDVKHKHTNLGIIAKGFSHFPASWVWCNKEVSSPELPSVTSSTERNTLFDKHGNMFGTLATKFVMKQGTMASASKAYIETILLADQLEADLTTAMVNILTTMPVVPYNDAGFGIVSARLNATLFRYLNVGSISSFDVKMPDLLDIPPADRANRWLSGITFTAIASGAIQGVEIKGTIVEV